MKEKFLVTYASRTGSTAEIAEAIYKELRQAKVNVGILPRADVKDLSAYGAVIIGSSIRKSRWLPEAMQFIHTHRAILTQKRVATFTVSITRAIFTRGPRARLNYCCSNRCVYGCASCL